MSYRCTNAFLYDGKVYAGGCSVDDTDPILRTHADNFVKVQEVAGKSETASAAPAEVRTVAPEPKPEPEPEPDPKPRTRRSPRTKGNN